MLKANLKDMTIGSNANPRQTLNRIDRIIQRWSQTYEEMQYNERVKGAYKLQQRKMNRTCDKCIKQSVPKHFWIRKSKRNQQTQIWLYLKPLEEHTKHNFRYWERRKW